MAMDSTRMEDIGKIAESALSGAAGQAFAFAQTLRSEAQSVLHSNFERIANELHLARQGDLDDIKAMVVRGREIQDEILQRLDAIEARLEQIDTRNHTK